jgi:hypothetical protein
MTYLKQTMLVERIINFAFTHLLQFMVHEETWLTETTWKTEA